MVVWGGMTEVGLRVPHACGNPRILFDVVDTFCFICSYLLLRSIWLFAWVCVCYAFLHVF